MPAILKYKQDEIWLTLFLNSEKQVSPIRIAVLYFVKQKGLGRVLG